jgi:hypothetical protein
MLQAIVPLNPEKTQPNDQRFLASAVQARHSLGNGDAARLQQNVRSTARKQAAIQT